MNWLSWAPLVAASLHIIEEFVFPGGFPAWDRQYRPQFRSSISPRFHIFINGLLLIACYDVGVLGMKPVGVAAWLTVMALLCTNGIWHVVGAFRTRTYSPGMITGLFLYVPLTVYGYAHFLGSGAASVPTALIALAIGASYQLWVSPTLHKWRMRKA